jgi:hypothetical protein
MEIVRLEDREPFITADCCCAPAYKHADTVLLD